MAGLALDAVLVGLLGDGAAPFVRPLALVDEHDRQLRMLGQMEGGEEPGRASAHDDHVVLLAARIGHGVLLGVDKPEAQNFSL